MLYFVTSTAAVKNLLLVLQRFCVYISKHREKLVLTSYGKLTIDQTHVFHHSFLCSFTDIVLTVRRCVLDRKGSNLRNRKMFWGENHAMKGETKLTSQLNGRVSNTMRLRFGGRCHHVIVTSLREVSMCTCRGYNIEYFVVPVVRACIRMVLLRMNHR